MRTLIDYGAWVNGKHIVMERKQWLSAVRLIFPDESVNELKKKIRNERMRASRFPKYYPGKTTKYCVPYVCAYYHIEKGRKWLYIQPYGKGASVIHAVLQLLERHNIDSSQFEELRSCDMEEIKKGSSLDHRWKPHPQYIAIMIGELRDINYHSLAEKLENISWKKNIAIAKEGKETEIWKTEI